MEQEKSVWDEVLVEGCKRYSDEFYVQFIDGDRTWEVAQVVSYISGISGLVATVRVAATIRSRCVLHDFTTHESIRSSP